MKYGAIKFLEQLSNELRKQLVGTLVFELSSFNYQNLCEREKAIQVLNQALTDKKV